MVALPVAPNVVAVQVVQGWQKNLVPGIMARLNALGATMVKESRDIVPVDTGFLRESIHYVVQQRSVSTGRYDFPSLMFGADAPYAGFVEFGTSNMEAQPFIRPVVYKHRAKL